MHDRLKGNIAFVTGGARGLGAKMCWKFAEEGITELVIGDIREIELQKLTSELQKHFDVKVLPIVMDVRKEAEWIKAVNLIKKSFGGLSTLVNNAGITHRVSLLECSVEDWNNVIEINQTGVFLGIKHCAPLMKKQRMGSIINLSSIAGLTGYFASAYTASKWAVRGITKAAAMELGDWGIRVNSVHPGFIWSPLTIPAKKMVEKFEEVNALERTGEPEEVANAVVFLASEESSFITGTELVVDGGLTSGGGVRKVAKDLNIL